jgi:hypothetical protein
MWSTFENYILKKFLTKKFKESNHSYICETFSKCNE